MARNSLPYCAFFRRLPLLPVLFAACLLAAMDVHGQLRPQRAAREQRRQLRANISLPAQPARNLPLSSADAGETVPDEILVEFKRGRATRAMRDMERQHGIKALKHRRFRTINWHRVTVRADEDIEDTIQKYREHPDVLRAEPNYLVRAIELPDDTRFGELWGMHNTGQDGGTPDADIDAPEAWDYQTTSHVVVAVIDTGVDYNHPDLQDNMWRNPGEIEGNGVDDDGNGFVDDVYGYDFVNGDGDPMDGHSHGTHCAGTIAGVGDNSVGVAGVCWGAKIMAVKFLSDGGWGSTADAIESVEYATLMGAKISNNSWGGGGYSDALKDAITAAGTAGALFVAAAGNDAVDNDSAPHYPSSYDCASIIAVAASDRNDALTYFSCYGATSVDLAAPGLDILSTIPGDSYDKKSGTSMATPHVAGACALLWGATGDAMTYEEIRDALYEATDKLPSLAGKCATGGRLNIATAVALIGTNRMLRVREPNGGEGLESGVVTTIRWVALGTVWESNDTVKLEYSLDGGSNWDPVAGATNIDYDAETFSWDTTGYSPGTQYLVRVAHEAADGTNDVSDAPFALAGPLDHFSFVMSSPQPNGHAVNGTAFVTARDSDDVVITTYSTFNTNGRAPATITAPGVTIGGLGGAGSELAMSDFVDGAADLVALGMNVDVPLTPATVKFSAVSAGGKTGTSGNVVIDALPDYFTEYFDVGPFDLENRSVIFLPDTGPSGYCAYTREITGLPTDPAGHTVLPLWDDDAALVTLVGRSVLLYGSARDRFYVGSNGYITFDAGDTHYVESLERHFSLPRISPLFRDFLPVDGQVTWQQLDDRAVVTYNGVSEWVEPNTNTFQVELFYDGRIVFSYLAVDANSGIAGLSEGQGIPPDFLESDLSGYPAMPGRVVMLFAPNGGEAFVTGTAVRVDWNTYGEDWGGADTVTLDYSADGGSNWHAVAGAGSLAYDSGAFDWDTAGMGIGNDYRIRVSVVGVPAVSDISMHNFSLTSDRRLEITSPNGGEPLDTGSSVPVTWTASGGDWDPADTITLDYSSDNGATWSGIPGGAPLAYDAGSHTWDLTGLSSGGGYLARVTWPTDPAVNDTSDGTFVLRTTYYVNDNSVSNDIWCGAIGDDANSGRDTNSPKASVQAVIDAYDLGSGDRVVIDTGSYDLDEVIVLDENDSGSWASPLVFEGSPYGVTLTPVDDYVWEIYGADGITIRTAESDKYPGEPKRRMKFTGGYVGLDVYESRFFTLENVEVSGNEDGMYVDYSEGFTCTGSLIGDNEMYGMSLWDSYACALRNNVIRDNWDTGIDAWDANWITMTHNVIARNGYYGVLLWSGFATVENNTFDRNEVAQIEVADDRQIVVRNNIFRVDGEDNTAVDLWVWEFPACDHNLFSLTGGALFGYGATGMRTLPEWRQKTGLDMNSALGDPLFVDADGGDWHLQSTAGSYHGGAWTPDAAVSPGIDLGFGGAGDEPQPNSSPHHAANLGRRNVGAYGGTAEASLTPASREILLLEPLGAQNHVDQSVPLDVRWTWSGTNWQGADALEIEYSDDAGASWTGMAGAASVPVSDYAHAWDVSGVPVGLRYRVRLTCNEDPACTSSNAASFRIGGPLTWYVNDGSTSDDLWCSAPGNDLNDGGGPGSPKASVQAMLDACDLEPGDLLRIDTGLYNLTDNIVVEGWHSGSSNAPVTIEGSPHGVVIDRGDNSTKYNRVIELSGLGHLALRTSIDTNIPGVPIQWLRLTGGGGGLWVQGMDCVVERLEISGNADHGVECSWSDRITFRNNLVYDNGLRGFDISGPWDVELINNTVKNHAWQVWTEYGQYSPGDTVRLVNNILLASGESSRCIYAKESPWDVPESDHNLFHTVDDALVGYDGSPRATLADWQAATGQDANSLAHAPCFTSTAPGDHHLQSTAGSYHGGAWTADALDSPGIDTGNPGFDCGNEPDWNGGFVNCGAYGNTLLASKSQDTDDDGASDTFETHRLGSNPGMFDTDGDHQGDGSEYRAGTRVLDPTSYLGFSNVVFRGDSEIVLRWLSVSNRFYRLGRCSNLVDSVFGPFASNIPATPPLNTHTVDVNTATAWNFNLQLDE